MPQPDDYLVVVNRCLNGEAESRVELRVQVLRYNSRDLHIT